MIEPNTAMEAATEGAKALTKFQELLLKIFEPRFTRKKADADEYANQKKLDIIRNNPDMEIVYAGENMFARTRNPEELAARAEQRMLTDSIRQEENIEDIIDIAWNDIKPNQMVPEKSIDNDWLTRFISIAKDVSSEEMQIIWGKILSGEFANPGSFSLRTLETIKNLSRIDAETFQKILPLVVQSGSNFIISSNKDLMSKYDVTYGDIIELDECGLVNSSGTLSLDTTLSNNDNNDEFNYHSNNKIIIIKNLYETKSCVSVGVYTLTRSASELCKALQFDSNDDYIMDFAKQLRKENRSLDISITVHQIKDLNDDYINYDNTVLASFPKEGA